MKLARITMLLLLILALQGCGYYSQIISGHMRIVLSKRPVTEVLQDSSVHAETKRRLELARDVREFAIGEMALPDNKSYTSFYDTNRDYITWNVVAAGEFSFAPKQWCFPIAGCVSYRGYYAEKNAQAYAESLARKGLDVAVYGATAYSTLGWFADPLLNTMLNRSDPFIASLLFHELAHQKIYVSDDSKFNESFATFVEQVGLQRWLKSRQSEDQAKLLEKHRRRQEEFVGLLMRTRKDLQGLYESGLEETVMRMQKAQRYNQLLDDYEKLKASWGGYQGYDAWFKRQLSNARLVSIATYNDYIPAFKVLFGDAGENFAKFYTMVEEIGEQPRAQRTETMLQLMHRNGAGISASSQ